jgi:zinc transporter 5/7
MQLVERQALQPQYFGLSHPVSLILSYVLGTIAFKQVPSWTDVFVASILYVGKFISTVRVPVVGVHSQISGMYPEGIEVISAPPRTPGARLVKSYLKTILSNPESRKIFYFLMLNLSYMLIQMLYGIWTNSLGLISDGKPPFLLFPSEYG